VIDLTALGYLLAVTGPATLPDGTMVSARNVVALTQRTAYARFSDDAARKRYLLDVGRAVGARLLGGAGDPASRVWALVRVAGERRLLVWSADPALQGQLERTPVAGTEPRRTAGSSLSMGPATSPADAASPGYSRRVGDNLLLVSYYATAGAQLVAVTLDGVPTTASPQRENGHPVYTRAVELPVSRTRTLVVDLREPALAGPVTVLRQPLVRPLRVTTVDRRCG